jgi:hypothetical protein
MPPFEFLLHGDPPLDQHPIHALLEGVLALLQLLAVPGQLGEVPGDLLLPALEGLPLSGEPVLGGMEVLLSEAKLPLAFASFCFSNGEPSLL